MAFRLPATYLQSALTQVLQNVTNIKNYLLVAKGFLSVDGCNADRVLSIAPFLGSQVAALDVLAATPGIAAYAQAQMNDSTYDISTEYTNMRTALLAVRDGVVTNFPKDATTGFLMYQTQNADGSISQRTFTAAQLSGIVTLINSALSTIG